MAPADVDEKQARMPVQQLAILCICRFAEPLAFTSVFPYLPEMIESFSVPEKDVPKWAGITSLVFSLAQAATSIQWGRASDRFGRKPTILLALFLVMVSTLILGFSQNLTTAIAARALAGASNGNVGILRTTVAELVPQKSLQPLAFSILPMLWAVGSSIGPSLGGSLAVPTRQFPRLFAGNAFFEKYKFALPNLVSAVFFAVGLFAGFFFLRETLETKRNRKDRGLILGKKMTGACRRRKIRLPHETIVDQEAVPTSPQMARKHPVKPQGHPSWGEVFTYQSSLNILAYTILAFHLVTFDQVVPVFLHLKPQDHSPESGNVSLPFKFSGGFGLESGRIGLLFTIMGAIGIVAQFAVFPPVARKFGVLTCFRWSTFFCPILYFAVPYTVLLPTDETRQGAIFALMVVKVLVSTFAFPCTTILLTNSASSVRILGTLNGVAVATSAIGRATGPFIAGGSFTWGIHQGYVIVPWFILGATSVIGYISTLWLIEMDGPSSSVPVDEEDKDEEEEIVLLPKDDEPEAHQSIGIFIGGEGDLPKACNDRPRMSLEEEDDNDTINEHSPLLRAASSSRPISRDSSLNIGGTTMTNTPRARSRSG